MSCFGDWYCGLVYLGGFITSKEDHELSVEVRIATGRTTASED